MPKDFPVRRTRVLGRGMLPEVWRDMNKTVLPTWLSAGPREVGTASCGKLSADQWRTTCTVHLVITLGRLWGAKTHDDRLYQMYANFMDLVSAVKLATMRSMTSSRSAQYKEHIRCYLTGIKTLYKCPFSPNQHIALHLDRLLRLFGPVHAWRSYPFERWNYILQSIPTNFHLGAMEVTMFERFCRMQNLLSYWNDKVLDPEILDSLSPAFDKAFQSDRRGTLLTDLHSMHDPSAAAFDVVYARDGTQTKLPVEHEVLLTHEGYKNLKRTVLLHESCVFRGATFRMHKASDGMSVTGDSLIIIGSDVQASWEPCRIEAIYEVRSDASASTLTKFLVRTFEPLDETDALQDPYRAFRIAGGRIYYSALQINCRLISPGDVLSHFALTQNVLGSISRPHIHVLPLDRVSSIHLIADLMLTNALFRTSCCVLPPTGDYDIRANNNSANIYTVTKQRMTISICHYCLITPYNSMAPPANLHSNINIVSFSLHYLYLLSFALYAVQIYAQSYSLCDAPSL